MVCRTEQEALEYFESIEPFKIEVYSDGYQINVYSRGQVQALVRAIFK